MLTLLAAMSIGVPSSWYQLVRPFSYDRHTPFVAGQHRNVEVKTRTGTSVRAIRGGRVGFAGRVAGIGIVTVRSAGQGGRPVNVTYVGLDPLRLRVGVRIRPGDRLGIARGGVVRIGLREPSDAFAYLPIAMKQAGPVAPTRGHDEGGNALAHAIEERIRDAILGVARPARRIPVRVRASERAARATGPDVSGRDAGRSPASHASMAGSVAGVPAGGGLRDRRASGPHPLTGGAIAQEAVVDRRGRIVDSGERRSPQRIRRAPAAAWPSHRPSDALASRGEAGDESMLEGRLLDGHARAASRSDRVTLRGVNAADSRAGDEIPNPGVPSGTSATRSPREWLRAHAPSLHPRTVGWVLLILVGLLIARRVARGVPPTESAWAGSECATASALHGLPLPVIDVEPWPALVDLPDEACIRHEVRPLGVSGR